MIKDIANVNDIRLLVEAFYKRAEKDDLLAPFFAKISDTEVHKEKLCLYWQAVLLTATSEQSEPLLKHEDLRLSKQHFIRWLTLFLETIDVLYAGPTAEKAKVLVIRKCEEFQYKLELTRF